MRKGKLNEKDNADSILQTISKETGIIKTISYRKILNSHVEFTNEFIIEMNNNSFGIGSAPKGETISIYEDSTDNNVGIEKIIENINTDLCDQLNQEKLDDYLDRRMHIFGRNNCYAISEAFFNAMNKHNYPNKKIDNEIVLCMNFLNGGKYAYTNPVLSDFPEYLLISRKNNLTEVIKDHNDIQNKIREKLLIKNKITVNNNLVSKFDTADNRQCIEFLIDILDSLNLTDKYDLMIDASAGDLLTKNGYQFSITDSSLKTSYELYEYWMNIIKDYNIKFLEDPFHEKDYESWKQLTTTQNKCNIIGDNLYSSDPKKIMEGISRKYTNGIIAKPNQAGTVSTIIRAIQIAQDNNQIVITSHRSISTESIFLSILTNICKVRYIKIGPLNTDYSSIIRLNELIRLKG